MKFYSPAHRTTALLAAVCLVAVGCATASPTEPDAGGTKRTGSLAKKTAPGPEASPGVVPPTAAPDPTRGYFGRVLGLDGNPQAGVRIEARVLADHGGSLITDNGAGLITDNGAGVIANHGGGIIANNSGTLVAGGQASYRLQAGEEILTATSAADGTFTLAIPAGKKANVEAIQASDVKAIRGAVTSDGRGFDLKLAPTGALQGTVTTPADRQITNYQGVDVYIPGTSYLAKADAAGNFKIDNVPVGAYKLFAEKVGLGSGVSSAVEVKSREAAQVAELMLQIDPVTITALEPAFAMAGATVTVKGTHFGKSSGALFKLRIGGVEVEKVDVLDDGTATFVVPKGAKGGALVVEVAGLKSEPRAFGLVDSFDVTGPDVELAPGSVFQSRATTYDTDYETMTATLPLVWKVLSGDAVTVDQTGKITASKVGVATVEAAYAGLAARFAVRVSSAAGQATTLGGVTARAASQLSGVATGADGQIYVSTLGRILKVGADGAIATLAGGAAGEAVIDATGKNARFEEIGGLAFDPAGRLLVSDSMRLRAVTLPEGAVSTLAGLPFLNWDSDLGVLDGVGTAAGISWSTSIAAGAGGTSFFLDSGSLRRLGPTGQVDTFEGTASLGALGAAADGSVYGLGSAGAYTVSPAGAVARVVPQAAVGAWPSVSRSEPRGVARDEAGNLYLAYETAVLKLADDGAVSILAGGTPGRQDGTGAAARFQDIRGIALQPGGSLIVTEEGAVRQITLEGAVVTTIVHGESGGVVYEATPIGGRDALAGAGGGEGDGDIEE